MTTTIRCGKCQATHASVDAVRACHTGDLFTCHWAVQRSKGWVDEETGESEFWDVVEDCGADATATATGWACAAGHVHVTMEARMAEGWDYAECYEEAQALAFAGVEPRTMTGHSVTGRADFAPAWA